MIFLFYVLTLLSSPELNVLSDQLYDGVDTVNLDCFQSNIDLAQQSLRNLTEEAKVSWLRCLT